MSEKKDWAEFYERHRDDPEMWGELEEGTPPTRRRDRLSATITVRFSPEEASGIRELAKELGVSYSEIVRRAVQEFTRPRSTTGYEKRSGHEDVADDLSLSNSETSTGLLVLN